MKSKKHEKGTHKLFIHRQMIGRRIRNTNNSIPKIMIYQHTRRIETLGKNRRDFENAFWANYSHQKT